jgi:hypothetical protein
VLAQLGRKPSGAQALKQLLEPAVLPGAGWTTTDQRTWRTGVDATTDWQRRANAAGSVTAWRSFERAGHDRWLWIQVTPLADVADAASAFSDAPERMLRNKRAVVRLVDEREVPPPAALSSETAWALEQRAEGKVGESLGLLLIAVFGRNLITVAGSGVGRQWSWDEIGQLASRQATRLTA